MKTKIVLVGVGGYGTVYLQELLNPPPEKEIEIAGVIDPEPQRSGCYAEMLKRRIPLYDHLEAFYQHSTADLAVIVAPIQLHAPLTCLALSQGSQVLCEKPLAASLDDAHLMLAAEEKYDKKVAIGYQWSFSPSVLALKGDILAGRLGKPLQLKTAVLWSRSHAYFQRNDWAGRIRTLGGAWVLDSPVNNATAHYLHNMLYILGSMIDESACPESLQVELYRANSIENYDTAALRLRVGEVPLLFLTTHAVNVVQGPLISYVFERGVVEYSSEDPEFRVCFRDGTSASYGSPAEAEFDKLWQMVEIARRGGQVACSVRTAIPHLLSVLAAQQAPITPFPASLLREEGEAGARTTWVEGLAESLLECYNSGMLPSELGAPWAVKTAMFLPVNNNNIN
jgi:predicted dehydrogenase